MKTMTERFYTIKHLSTAQLRELYSAYRKQGWIDAEYHELMPEGIRPPELSEGEILLNIDAGDTHNYFAFMLDHPDEEDGIMIGFGMSYHPDFAVYLHLPPRLLDELIKKYALPGYHEGNCYKSLTEFILSDLKYSMN
jgi:hypothetical protein